MICRFRFTAIAASMLLAVPALALDAKFSSEELPNLTSEPQHKTATIRTTSKFTESHYKRFSLDDKFSSEMFDRYLQSLDYNRLFLTQKDVNKLDKWRTKLDNQLKAGDTSAAYSIFNTVLKKRFERYEFALSLLDKEITFDSKESMEVDRSEAEWAKDDRALDELWRLRVKSDALNLKLAGKDWDDIRSTLEKRYNNALKRLTQTKSEDVFQVYLNAFAREVDPHTSYLSPRNAEQFQSEMNLSLEGIGAVLQLEDDYTVIRSLVAGGPASKSKKLSPGDRIIGVAQENSNVIDVIGWRLDDVVQLIKGPKGSKVKLEILPDGSNAKSFKVTIVRDKIRLEDRAVKSEVIEKDGEKIGLLTVPSFYVGLTEDSKKEIQSLNEQDVKGIIIDLRNNGGGALSEATTLTGLFVKNGPIVQVRDSYGRVRVNTDNDNRIFYDGPLTVMINRYSASASEIFAAALQDYGRALIVGEQSFGKGTVQQHKSLNKIYDLFDKPVGHIQYTIQKFYRIDGGSTQHLGVIPDISFPSPVDPEETGESVEDNALPWDSIDPAAYSKVGDVTPLVDKLTLRHQKRISSDMEFSFIFEDIETFKKDKDNNQLSLVEKERIAERNEAETERLARLNARQKEKGEEIFKSLDDVPNDYEEPDAYLNEAVEITLEYGKLLKS
ncbi:carboxy terminal-processing peptidase [Veronia nyctiphanis]|uniref:Carboxy terminal-processing peptidase n=1 Tax=Veronia nyctiphanis TaxID=1278244 RepID=A0A4Q0YU62_9GAMM|nr:carboxy terminal-processing peptidase [Veronia nyctiphanis]RXJ74293.1 carboxy terminal-processing peptidase [Veronia nyctiphanis]